MRAARGGCVLAAWLGAQAAALPGCGSPGASSKQAAPPTDAASAPAPAVAPAASITGAPAAAAVEGIDVSHVQQAVDWPSVARSGKTFVFVKATQGISEVDPRFVDNWQGALAAGLRRGAYHFFQPGDDPAAQADHFLRTVVLAAGDLPPVLDIETAQESAAGSVEAAQQLVKDVAVWLNRVSGATKRPIVVYTTAGFWDALPTVSLEPWSQFPLWVAEYGVTTPRTVRGWQSWTFWQYSQTGRVPGIPVAVDLSRFTGDLDALTALGR
jgi:lysozyme